MGTYKWCNTDFLDTNYIKMTWKNIESRIFPSIKCIKRDPKLLFYHENQSPSREAKSHFVRYFWTVRRERNNSVNIKVMLTDKTFRRREKSQDKWGKKVKSQHESHKNHLHCKRNPGSKSRNSVSFSYYFEYLFK